MPEVVACDFKVCISKASAFVRGSWIVENSPQLSRGQILVGIGREQAALERFQRAHSRKPD